MSLPANFLDELVQQLGGPGMGHDMLNNCNNACQPRLGACGASLSSPGRIVLSDLIRAGNRQVMNVKQDHVVLIFLGLPTWPGPFTWPNTLSACH